MMTKLCMQQLIFAILLTIYATWLAINILIKPSLNDSYIIIDKNNENIPEQWTTNINHYIKHKNTSSNVYTKLPIPSLVIIGPTKTGTTTLWQTLMKFPNFNAFPQKEYYYWALSSDFRCLPNYNKSQWIYFLNNFENNKIKLTSLINTIISKESTINC
eukprot:22553_1